MDNKMMQSLLEAYSRKNYLKYITNMDIPYFFNSRLVSLVVEAAPRGACPKTIL